MTDLLTNYPSKGYFSLKQCIYSDVAIKNNINNFPGSDFDSIYGKELSKDKIINNLHKLFKTCINPIKKRYPGVKLTSVYRNKKLNELIGGAPFSQHIYGYAADMVFPDSNTSALFNWCRLNLPMYHQLIWEYPERGQYFDGRQIFSWIHISYIEGNNFKENSVSSLDPKIHNFYKDESIYTIGNFTHGIKEANQDLIKQ